MLLWVPTVFQLFSPLNGRVSYRNVNDVQRYPSRYMRTVGSDVGYERLGS